MNAQELWTRLWMAATPKQRKAMVKAAREAFGRSVVDQYVTVADAAR